MNKGYIAAFSAYFWWGLSPIYWKLISEIPALEILSVRVLLSLPILLLLLFYQKKLQAFWLHLKNIKQVRPFVLSAFLLGANWFIFIWAMNNDHIVEASLGYFINPLVNVVMGVILLKEKMRRMQWVAIFLALNGVLYLAVNYGQFPWIALILAGSFASYGYIRKTAPLGALDGLTAEMSALFIPSVLLLTLLAGSPDFILPGVSWHLYIWLSLTAVITIIPLVLFAYGARKIPYSTLGLIQYIAPTLQFLIGVFVYNESFNKDRFVGFSFIWLALILYTFENLYVARKTKKAVLS